MQQGDVYLFQTNDDGDISITGGIVKMSGGLATTAYLSMFGGNEDLSLEWWGNIDENEIEKRQVSETQNILQSLPATSYNMKRVEDAVRVDLGWLVDTGVATSVVVFVSIPALNRVRITVSIDAERDAAHFEFLENWKVTL